MSLFSRGFSGKRRETSANLPPGQHLVRDFPVLTAGPTPRVSMDEWQLTLTTELGVTKSWDWQSFRALPTEDITVDLHCVTSWSKLGTHWQGVLLDALLADCESTAEFVSVRSYGGYTTNLPLADLRGGKAWIAFGYEGEDLDPEHGGPARLLVPHLYLWKSAKWVRDITLTRENRPGFWETNGYHNYGDPWREQRYWDE